VGRRASISRWTLEQLGVHLDMDARRPTALPDAIRERAKAILVQ